MSPDSQARFANLAPLQTDAVLSDLIRAAGEEGLWAQVLPLVPQMNESGRALAANLSGQLDGEQLLAVAQVATEHALWPIVIDLIRLMAPDQRQSVFGLLGVAPARALEGMLQALETQQQWLLLQAALPEMAGVHRARLQERAAALGFEHHFSGFEGMQAATPSRPPSSAPMTRATEPKPSAQPANVDEWDALRSEQRALRGDLNLALTARTDLQDLINATAYANKTLRQQAQSAARWALLALTVSLAAVAVAVVALLG